VASPDVATAQQNKPITSNVLTNDFDPDGDVLTVKPVPAKGPNHGTVVIDASGTYTYTPAPGYTGRDTFWYTVCDSKGNCVTRPVVITVTPDSNGSANDAPSANDDAVITPINTPIPGNMKGNDTDPNGDVLTYDTTPVIPPTNGTVVINADGTYTYTPAAGFIGNDQFVYRVCDARGLCSVATVYISIQSVKPNTKPDINNTDSGKPATGNASTNDVIADGPGSYRIDPAQPGACGTVTMTSTGAYTYTPVAGSTCTRDSFRYIVCNASGQCESQWVYINLIPNINNNRPPVASPDAEQTKVNTPVSNSVIFNDFDLDGDVILVQTTLLKKPMHGTVVMNADGTYTYTPTSGYIGRDTFWYTVCDSKGSCSNSFVVITITSQQSNSPVANDDASYTNGGLSSSGNLSGNDRDPNGGKLTYNTTPTTPPAHGTVVINSDGTYTYTPTPGYSGPDQFTYTVCNSLGFCSTATVYILNVPARDIADANYGISPNEDGLNDVWVIPGIESRKHQIYVYNRWGNLVFYTENYKSTDSKNSFNGSWNNTTLPDGTYFYIIDLKNENQVIRGYIEVYR
jgi:gliding motility-associated-like protein